MVVSTEGQYESREEEVRRKVSEMETCAEWIGRRLESERSRG